MQNKDQPEIMARKSQRITLKKLGLDYKGTNRMWEIPALRNPDVSSKDQD